ncbi:MAG: hypothetical protein P9L92_20810 [Candidatus Electryonea clarkiae]|nr:hypothetical protein [Candidatus Electryonea clarkiae]MDP8288526.1 hypothetical protein [Candidatus Electryonea clarkiae]
MATMLDILGSMIIGSMLLLIAITAMDNAVQQFVNHNADAIVQNEMVSLTEIIQHDLRKMGFGIPEAEQNSILQIGQPDHLKFLANLNINSDYYAAQHGNIHIDAIPDTIEYSIAAFDTIDFIDTSIVLYSVIRTVKVTQESPSSGHIGSISNDEVFSYLDQLGNETGVLQATKMVEVTLIAMNPDIYVNDEVLLALTPVERMNELRKLIRQSFWRQTRVISKNLRR